MRTDKLEITHEDLRRLENIQELAGNLPDLRAALDYALEECEDELAYRRLREKLRENNAEYPMPTFSAWSNLSKAERVSRAQKMRQPRAEEYAEIAARLRAEEDDESET